MSVSAQVLDGGREGVAEVALDDLTNLRGDVRLEYLKRTEINLVRRDQDPRPSSHPPHEIEALRGCVSHVDLERRRVS